MTEKTLIKTLPLPADQTHIWYPDANVFALAAHLTQEEREATLDKFQVEWRRSCLRVVPAQTSSGTIPTIPVRLPPAALTAVRG